MSKYSISSLSELDNMYYTDSRLNPPYNRNNQDTNPDNNSENTSNLNQYVNEPRNNINLQLHLEDQHASKNAKYVKNIIYGGLDGIITTFSIIAAAVGASLEMRLIIAMGVANLIADGISMGVGEYLSTTFENKYISSEKAKEEHEFDNNHDYEVEEMIELYQNEGLDLEDAKEIVNIYTSKDKYKPLFIKNMMAMELGLEINDDDPRINGLVTFVAFLIFGFVPVLFYIIFYFSDYHDYNSIFIINCFITIITIFILGIVQAKITKQPLFISALKLTMNGVIASSMAFLIGWGIEQGIN